MTVHKGLNEAVQAVALCLSSAVDNDRAALAPPFGNSFGVVLETFTIGSAQQAQHQTVTKTGTQKILSEQACCVEPPVRLVGESVVEDNTVREEDAPSASCWERARHFLSTSGDPVSEHPALLDEGNLQKFCCYPTAFSSQVCWGAGREGGSAIVRDSSDGAELNFTMQYALCCLPQLQELTAVAEPPAWVSQSLDYNFAPWADRGPFSMKDLDDAEAADAAAAAAELTSGTTGRALGVQKLCRFQVRGMKVLHCDFKQVRYDNLMFAVRNALHIIQAVAPLPDFDFLVYADELYGVAHVAGSGSRDRAVFLNSSIPLLVQAQPQDRGGVLMPWWAYLQLDWTRLYSHRLQRASSKVPWPERAPSVFWRGSDTGCLLPGACENPSDHNTSAQGVQMCQCSNWTRHTWARFPRSRLVLASTLMPDRIDARYTKDVVHWDCAETYDASHLWIDEIVPPEQHVKYKYLIYLDGLSFSDRLYWLMLTGSLIFRASSQLRVWLDDEGLKPWEHYVPVKEDLTDLVDQLDWAKQNDEQASLIASRGATFASEHLSLEGNLHYFYRVLLRMATLFPSGTSPSFAAGHVAPAPRAPLSTLKRPSSPASSPTSQAKVSSVKAQESLECWALGYTPEFCCNVDQFGPGGNVACWDGPYTFESCCVGRLSDHRYWAQRDARSVSRADE